MQPFNSAVPGSGAEATIATHAVAISLLQTCMFIDAAKAERKPEALTQLSALMQPGRLCDPNTGRLQNEVDAYVRCSQSSNGHQQPKSAEYYCDLKQLSRNSARNPITDCDAIRQHARQNIGKFTYLDCGAPAQLINSDANRRARRNRAANGSWGVGVHAYS